MTIRSDGRGPARTNNHTRSTGSTSSNDMAALEALYRQEYDASVRLAHLLVGDRGRAEELAQDAFVRIAPHVARADNPGAYLRTAVVNLCRDAGRRTTRTGALPIPPERFAPEPPVPHTATAVWDALQQLPERQRVAVTLRYYLDLPDAEIAEVLGARPTTVRTLVHRAFATLKEAIADD